MTMTTTRTANKRPAAKKTTVTVRVSTPRKASRPATKTPTRARSKTTAVKSAVKRVVATKSASTLVSNAPKQPVQRPAAPKKVKLVRDSFSFPEHEHALLAAVKKRAQALGQEFKKSEILRAGMQHLSEMADHVLLAALSRVERVKTGRPAKKSKKK